jgi:hydroxymethylpyrimidine pyrophosphatase-like HAD family hydrolase
MDKKADKGCALQVICDHYGIDRKEVMAMGDSFNDIAMIEWAGVGVAMGNAYDMVKDAADYVTTSNDEDGVAEAIRKFVLE